MSKRTTNICRPYVHSLINNLPLQCKKGDRCRFYHPDVIDESVIEDYNREPGRCYCGSSLRTLINQRAMREDETEPMPFFAVCGKTGKSISRCKGQKRPRETGTEEIILQPEINS